MRIEGPIVHKTDSYIVVETNGVGYKVLISPQTALSNKQCKARHGSLYGG